MNIHKKLKLLSESKSKSYLVKRYLLDCCEKYCRYRSKGLVSQSISVAKKCMNGSEKWKKLYDLEWYLEAQAFEIDHYRERISSHWPRLSSHTRTDLIRVRLRYHLNYREASLFLMNLAYFIDSVFVYIGFPENGIPPEEFEEFMCPKLFYKYFGKNA